MPDVSPRLTAALSDRYRIEQELGAGGMAAVYLAEDLKRQRQVAIKALKPKLAAVLGAERFVERQIGEGGMTTELPSGRPPFTGGTPQQILGAPKAASGRCPSRGRRNDRNGMGPGRARRPGRAEASE